jgi:hypothetical protein
MNVYLYVGDNPINHIDPLGLQAVRPALSGARYASPLDSPRPVMMTAYAERFYQQAYQRLSETIARGDRRAIYEARVELLRLDVARNGPVLQRAGLSQADQMEAAACRTGMAAVRALERDEKIRTEQFFRTIARMPEAEREQARQAFTLQHNSDSEKSEIDEVFEVKDTRSGPTEPYSRAKYGKTPTGADRKALGAGADEVANHEPPLVKRFYEGDPAIGEKPGYQMTAEELRASGADRSRMNLQPKTESNQQGAEMSRYSRVQKEAHDLE